MHKNPHLQKRWGFLFASSVDIYFAGQPLRYLRFEDKINYFAYSN